MSLETFVPAEAPIAGQTLPQAYYVSPEIFEVDLERVFARSWLLIGAEVELPRPGDTLTWTVGHESGLVTRADDGALHAHHNVCRHRGCRLQPDGVSTARVVVCPTTSGPTG